MKRRRVVYKKLILRGFRHGISRFLAIFAIVALGLGFFVGISATAPDMRLSGDKYYDDSNMMDLRVVSTMGLTEDDVAAVRGSEGVAAVMPAYSADLLLTTPQGDTAVTRVHSLPQQPEGDGYLNKVNLIDGRMPQAPGECVMEVGGYLFDQPLGIGDTLQISADNEDAEDSLGVDTFTVVGTVQSAYYFSIEREHTTVGSGTVDLTLYTVEDSFSYEVYTDMFMTVADAAVLNCFSDEYADAVAVVSDRLEQLAPQREDARHDELVSQARSELDDAWEEYRSEREQAESELAAAAQELEDGRSEIERQKAALADGWTQYEAGLAEYEDGLDAFEQEMADRGAELEAGREELAGAKEELTAAKEQLDQAAPQIEAIRPYVELDPQAAERVAQYDASLAAVEAGLAQLSEKEAELAAGEQALQDAKEQAEAELSEAKKTLDESRQTLVDGEAALSAAEEELADGEQEYEQAKQEAEDSFRDAESELNDAEQDILDIPQPQWYIFDRNDNLSYDSFRKNADNMEAISAIFPVFFFLIAALVSLTTMTRFVEEERGLIGTLKALGYKNGAIASKYLIYAGTASVCGSAFGLSFGFTLFPAIIWNAYEMMYTLPPLLTPFHANYAILSSAVAILLCLAATYSACRASLRVVPAQLLQPRAPKPGKRVLLERVTPLWKRLKFTQKVTVRNLFRYKKRFFMTVIGIAGCTALLITGFGLRDSINDIVRLQFDELYQYNMTVSMKNGDPMLEGGALRKIMDDESRVSGYILTDQQSATVRFGGASHDVTLCVPENTQDLPSFVTLRERRSHDPVEFGPDSVVLTEKLTEQLGGVSPGSRVVLELGDGRTAEVTVTGVMENYISAYVYIAREAYESAFGADTEFQTIYAAVPDAAAPTRDALSEEILEQDDINAVFFSDLIEENFRNMISKIDYIVIVLIVSAGALAFIVLYNLTNINIAERERELATIKVLGFFDGEVSAYIYRETALLSIIGIFFGMGMGVVLHSLVVRMAEIDAVMFGRNVYPLSFVYAALITLAFTAIVSVIMHVRLKKIDMVESLKSNE